MSVCVGVVLMMLLLLLLLLLMLLFRPDGKVVPGDGTKPDPQVKKGAVSR